MAGSMIFFQVIKMLIMVVVIFLTCWGPKLILNLMIKHRLAILYQPGSEVVKVCNVTINWIEASRTRVIRSVNDIL